MNGESLNSIDRQAENLLLHLQARWQNTQILSGSQNQQLTEASLEQTKALQQLHAVVEVRAQNEKLAGRCEELTVEPQNYQELLELTPDGYVVTNSKAIVVAANQTAGKLLNCSLKQLLGKPLIAFLIGESLCQFNTVLEQLQTSQHQAWEVRIQPKKLACFNAVFGVSAVRGFHGEVIALHWLLKEQLDSKREPQVAQRTIELATREIAKRQQVEAALQQQTVWARLMMAMQARIGQHSNLKEILTTTVAEVREFLCADRVVIYKLEPNEMTNAIAESVDAAYISVLGLKMDLPLLQQEVISYCQGNPNIIHNTQLVDSTTAQLQHQQVKASLTVPIILYEGKSETIAPPLLWGLLAIHQCREARFWQPNEVELLQQLATQISVAIRQLQYQQVAQLTTNLESQVQKRTTQLQKFLDFEATLKRISDDVRDTLDEKQILQTVVWELAVALNLHGCNTGLYDAWLTTSTISYEYTQGLDAVQGQVVQMQDFSEGYQQLLQGQYFQFCELGSQWRTPVAILACPICDDRGTIGDLWLFKPAKAAFDDLEIRLVQQVANQCAIAIRQARLFQAAQAKIQELETLNRLKDDFVDTVSHELRSPLANMKMAIQMLGKILLRDRSALPQLTQLEVVSAKVNRYLQILHHECDRELNLIDNLLDLQLAGDTQPSLLSAIQLQHWLPQFVEPFQERSNNQKQNLVVDIPPDLPRLICEPSSLSRVLAELLNNACKYTPAGEKILVTAKVVRARDTATLPLMQLDVTNWGVEIPASEIPRIFEKFYRIRAHDRWNQGGTGLGLALVQQLVTHLGGEIAVESSDGRTCFSVKIPLN